MNLDIYQLSKLLSKQKVRALGLFKDHKVDSETKYLYLFENIIDNKIRNDAEAKKALSYSSTSKAFLKFKERYTNKILDYIILSETSVKSKEFINDEYCRLLQLYLVAKIIHYKQPSNDSIKLFNRVFAQAKKYEFLDLQLFTGMHIKSHYAFKEPDKKTFEKLKNELGFINEKLNKTIELDKFYDEISHMFVVTKHNFKDDFKQKTLETSKKFIEEIESNDTYLYKSKAYEIAAYASSINNQFEESIEISKKSIEISKEKDHVPKYKIYSAYKDIISNYLKLSDFYNAKENLKKILSLFTVQNYNFFQMKGLEYTLYSLSKDYDNLYITTQNVISSNRLSDFQIHLEQWKLREAFANILLESGKVDIGLTSAPKFKKFKLNKFLNEVELFSKDKRGTNISILIVEIIHSLIRKQYDKLINRFDALNQYSYRYLRNDETLRSNCFIKMLMKLPEAEYHPLRTKRYVEKYEKKLKENPLKVSLKSMDIEIIPYEHLWEIIIEILDINLNKNKAKR